MEVRKLGQSSLEVSRLCFGTLTMGPLQRNFTPSYGAELLAEGFLQGINCLDTAEYYQNYDHIREGLRHKPDAVVITKCHAYDRAGALDSVDKALSGLGRKYLDCMMLHEQESRWTLKGHEEALNTFAELKDKGILRSIGVSTHFVDCAQAASAHPGIDILEAICNQGGVGIIDGTEQDMEDALSRAHDFGKGVVAIKALAGGHYSASPAQSIRYVLEKPFIDCLAVGMQSAEEIVCHVALAENRCSEEMLSSVLRQSRVLHVADWCIGCGTCERRCQAQAIRVVNGKAIPDLDKCVLCGYCAGSCPEFCIKVF